MLAFTANQARAIVAISRAPKRLVRLRFGSLRAGSLIVAATVALFCGSSLDAAKHEKQEKNGSSQPPTEVRDQCAPEPGDFPPPLPAKLLDGQGRVHFPITTTSPEAQQFFDQGVSQMHSFWAREAERSFLQAAELDPTAPMPWWGIAMAAAGDYRPGFQLEFVNGVPTAPGADKPRPDSELKGGPLRARQAAQRALNLSNAPGKATPLEKLYIRAVAARRGIGSTHPAAEYVQALRDLIAQYPSEVEAKCYLALIIMSGFTTPDKKPREGTMEAIQILRGLLAVAPDHPGVNHYVIHGWEGSHSRRRHGRAAKSTPNWRLPFRMPYICPVTSMPRPAGGMMRN